MSKEMLRSREDIPAVPQHLVTSLADYILYAPVETMPIHGFEHLTKEAWDDFANEYVEYTHSMKRILSYEERVMLFVEASKLAYEVHQQERLPNSSEKLQIPARFLNPRIVTEDGWNYIREYYQGRDTGHLPSAN